MEPTFHPGRVFAAGALCASILAHETGSLAHGTCTQHREVCQIAALPPLHSTERHPEPGPVRAYTVAITVSATTSFAPITIWPNSR
jgi:hypothetical protein